MAKGMVFALDGEESCFGFMRVDREKLYGKKERIVVDESGQPCFAAWLTSDGAALVPPGGAAHVYVNRSFETVERGSLRAVDERGDSLSKVAATLGVAQPLVGPVAPERVLEHVTATVYELHAESLGERLRERLASGAIFETRFNYREDYADSPMFLLQNEHGLFALLARDTGFDYLERDAAEPIDDAEQDEAEELDFAMM
jgi:hypothetical protein